MDRRNIVNFIYKVTLMILLITINLQINNLTQVKPNQPTSIDLNKYLLEGQTIIIKKEHQQV